MSLMLVGIGGVFGGVTRYQLGKLLTRKATTAFPVGTFLINVSGALLLGVLTSLSNGSTIYLLLGDGFLGAFTTFSTFMYEGFHLFRGKKTLNAAVYVLGTLILGIAGYALGYALGKAL